jgi:hypothetical protein
MKIIEDPSDPDTDEGKSFDLPTGVWIFILLILLAGAFALILWLG